MPKIRHLAIISIDPERLAGFYEEVFEMERVDVPGEAINLTDGYMNVTIIPNRAEGKPSGLNHFGIEVEDEDEIARRFAKWGLVPPKGRGKRRPESENRAADPDGNNFDVSARGFPIS